MTINRLLVACDGCEGVRIFSLACIYLLKRAQQGETRTLMHIRTSRTHIMHARSRKSQSTTRRAVIYNLRRFLLLAARDSGYVCVYILGVNSERVKRVQIKQKRVFPLLVTFHPTGNTHTTHTHVCMMSRKRTRKSREQLECLMLS